MTRGILISQQNDLFIKKINVLTQGKQNDFHRTNITSFSNSSAVRMRRYLRTCIADYKYLLTLTYPAEFPTDGKIFKYHLHKMLQDMRRSTEREYPSEIFSAFWFLEFQSRGAPHFHVLLSHKFTKEYISTAWFIYCQSGDTRHHRAGTRIETIRSGRKGMCAYVSKYACKSEQKLIPNFVTNAGRFWGIYGQRLCVSATTVIPVNDGIEFNLDDSINRLVSILNLEIKTALSCGKAKLISRSDSAHVIKLETTELKKSVLRHILKLECRNSLYGLAPKFWQEHHFTKITDETMMNYMLGECS